MSKRRTPKMSPPWTRWSVWTPRGKRISLLSNGVLHYYSVRQIGQALGYTSKGGNLSHLVRGKYTDLFEEGRDYLPMSIKETGRAIWMPLGSILILLGHEMRDHPKRAAAIKSLITMLLGATK